MRKSLTRLFAGSIIAAAPIAIAASSASATTSPSEMLLARSATSYLASQFNTSGYIPGSSGSVDYSDTLASVMDFAATNTYLPLAHQALNYIAANLNSYVVTAYGDGPGQLANVIIAVRSLGLDPTNFGGVNLINRLLATQQTTGVDSGMFGSETELTNYDAGAYDQGLALSALAYAGVTSGPQVQSAVAWLQGQQCSNGGFVFQSNANGACSGLPANFAGPDTNTTSVAIEGLVAQGALTPSAKALATTYFTTGQDSDGGFGYYANVANALGNANSDTDSTSLVVQALTAMGLSPTSAQFSVSGSNPISFLNTQQITTAGSSFGEFNYQGTPSLLATVQAVLGVIGAPHYNIVSPSNQGYSVVTSSGSVYAFGTSSYQGGITGSVNQPIVAGFATPDGKGYYLVAADGGVFAFGDATFYGSLGGTMINKPIVAGFATPDGKGYYLVAADGGVFAFGDATFYGSLGGTVLNKPIVAGFATPDGKGYYLVAADGGVFSFGDATFYGSLGGTMINKPIVAGRATPDGKGYYLIGADGGVFAFGDASFASSLPGSGVSTGAVIGAF